MRPVDIPGYNITLSKPSDMTDEQCAPLTGYGYRDKNLNNAKVVLTAWMPNKEDIEAINAGRPIYLSQVGESFHPVCLYTVDGNNEINQ